MGIYSQAYLLTKVLTATEREVIVYLYEGAISYLRRAIKARKAGNEALCGDSVDRVVSILIELSNCLDYDQNGSLALRLDSIYNYLIQALTMSNKEQDLEPLQTAEGIMNILADAWRQAIAADDQVERDEKPSRLRMSA